MLVKNTKSVFTHALLCLRQSEMSKKFLEVFSGSIFIHLCQGVAVIRGAAESQIYTVEV